MDYYSEKLAGDRLRKCYDIAPPRVKQYLKAEVQHVLSKIKSRDNVLELGCGYGRVAFELARAAGHVVGIDTARESIELAISLKDIGARCDFLEMDATDLKFPADEFDVVVCIQNGICAFGVDPVDLVKEAARVTRPEGLVLFSSYSSKFWLHRLAWFEEQARQGLLGEIDYNSTGEGTIVCMDGFRAGAMGEKEFRQLCRQIGIDPRITEVDESSIFCELIKTETF